MACFRFCHWDNKFEIRSLNSSERGLFSFIICSPSWQTCCMICSWLSTSFCRVSVLRWSILTWTRDEPTSGDWATWSFSSIQSSSSSQSRINWNTLFCCCSSFFLSSSGCLIWENFSSILCRFESISWLFSGSDSLSMSACFFSSSTCFRLASSWASISLCLSSNKFVVVKSLSPPAPWSLVFCVVYWICFSISLIQISIESTLCSNKMPRFASNNFSPLRRVVSCSSSHCLFRSVMRWVISFFIWSLRLWSTGSCSSSACSSGENRLDESFSSWSSRFRLACISDSKPLWRKYFMCMFLVSR